MNYQRKVSESQVHLINTDGTRLEQLLLADLAACEAALAEEQAKHQWRDIETAPKDRTVILVTDGDFITTAWWCKYDSLGGGNWLDEGRRIIAGVTRWQPLPQPPERSVI